MGALCNYKELGITMYNRPKNLGEKRGKGGKKKGPIGKGGQWEKQC